MGVCKIKGVNAGVQGIAEPMTYDLYSVLKDIKNGKYELCFYYDTNESIVKHGYMFRALKSTKQKSVISFITWCGFNRKDIVTDGFNSNLDTLCVKTKKWSSELSDKYAVEAIIDFMQDSKWFEACSRECSLSYVVSNNIKRGIFIIPRGV